MARNPGRRTAVTRRSGAVRHAPKSERAGAAVLELALTLPVLAFLVLATIEACNLIYMQQAITVAAYEGARTALVPGATEGNARAQVEQILTDREIKGATVDITPSNFQALTVGDFVSVSVEVDYSRNRLLPEWILGDRLLDATVQMMHEGY